MKLGPNPHKLSADVVRGTDWSRVKVVQRKARQETKSKDEQVVESNKEQVQDIVDT